MVTKGFGKSNSSWVIPDSEWRIRFHIAKNDHEYATYVDFDTLMWKEGLSEDDTMLSETTWNFAAAGWVAATPTVAVPVVVPDVLVIPNLYTST